MSGPLFTCIALSGPALISWKVPSHSLEVSSSMKNTSPGPASYRTTVKSRVGPAAPTGPTANGVAEWNAYRPAASGAAAVPVIGTAVYSPGLPDTKDANGSLRSTRVEGLPVAKARDENVPCPTKSYSQPGFPLGKLPLST